MHPFYVENSRPWNAQSKLHIPGSHCCLMQTSQQISWYTCTLYHRTIVVGEFTALSEPFSKGYSHISDIIKIIIHYNLLSSLYPYLPHLCELLGIYFWNAVPWIHSLEVHSSFIDPRETMFLNPLNYQGTPHFPQEAIVIMAVIFKTLLN